jgi:hypothetical protein
MGMFTAAEYNALPTIDVADRHAENLVHLREKLTNLISSTISRTSLVFVSFTITSP